MHCVGSSLLVEVSKVVEDLRVKRATIRLHAFMYELVSYFFVKNVRLEPFDMILLNGLI